MLHLMLGPIGICGSSLRYSSSTSRPSSLRPASSSEAFSAAAKFVINIDHQNQIARRRGEMRVGFRSKIGWILVSFAFAARSLRIASISG